MHIRQDKIRDAGLESGECSIFLLTQHHMGGRFLHFFNIPTSYYFTTTAFLAYQFVRCTCTTTIPLLFLFLLLVDNAWSVEDIKHYGAVFGQAIWLLHTFCLVCAFGSLERTNESLAFLVFIGDFLLVLYLYYRLRVGIACDATSMSMRYD